LRGEANVARLALPPVANQNQKFPYQSISGGGCGGSRLKNERKFYGFVSAASQSNYSHLYYNLLLSQNTT